MDTLGAELSKVDRRRWSAPPWIVARWRWYLRFLLDESAIWVMRKYLLRWCLTFQSRSGCNLWWSPPFKWFNLQVTAWQQFKETVKWITLHGIKELYPRDCVTRISCYVCCNMINHNPNILDLLIHTILYKRCTTTEKGDVRYTLAYFVNIQTSCNLRLEHCNTVHN